MNQFPVTKSFLDRDALARRLEDEYGLTEVRCQLITATVRDVYLVTSAQGRFALYIYRHAQRSPEQIAGEWELVDYLYRAGLPVAPAIPRSSGERLLCFLAPEGDRVGVLTQFAHGVTLRKRSSPALVRTYGQVIAKIHLLADRIPVVVNRPTLDYSAMIDDSIDAFQEEVADRPDELAYLHHVADTLKSRLATLVKEKPGYGIVHGDVIRANALAAGDGQITVLDFDFCGWGWRAYDVSSYIVAVTNTPQEHELVTAFLEGYEDVRPLANQERELLPLFEAVRAVVCIGIPAMNIEHWGSQYFYAGLDNDLAALRRSINGLARVRGK